MSKILIALTVLYLICPARHSTAAFFDFLPSLSTPTDYVNNFIKLIDASRASLKQNIAAHQKLIEQMQAMDEFAEREQAELTDMSSSVWQLLGNLPSLYVKVQVIAKTYSEQVKELNVRGNQMIQVNRDAHDVVEILVGNLRQVMTLLGGKSEDLPSELPLLLEKDQCNCSDPAAPTDFSAMTPRQVFDRAYAEYKSENHKFAHDLFVYAWGAYNKSVARGVTPDIGEEPILDYVQYTAYKIEDYAEAVWICNHLLANFNLSEEQRNKFKQSIEHNAHQLSAQAFKQDMESIDKKPIEDQVQIAEKLLNSSQYDACQDSNAGHTETLYTKPYAICRYSSRNRNPILLLAPVKEEVLSIEPPVMFFHELVLKSQCEGLKKEASGKFMTAGVVNPSSHQSSVESQTRKANIAWLSTNQFPRLSRRIEATVGLNPYESGAEMYQVGHYKIGGHYIPHYDMLFGAVENDTYRGDRIATLLLYLAGTELGGTTVFPKLALRATPEEGGALFWFNLFRNETNDMRTLHAACPLLRGEKWVTNKWFRVRGQMIHRRCTLNQDDEHHTHSVDNFDLPEEIFSTKPQSYREDFQAWW